MRMHKSKDYRCLTSEQKKQKYERKRRNAENMLYFIMAIPECKLNEAIEDGDLDMFECPFPVKYVLQKGYRIYEKHVICEAEYHPAFGLSVDEKWDEF